MVGMWKTDTTNSDIEERQTTAKDFRSRFSRPHQNLKSNPKYELDRHAAKLSKPLYCHQAKQQQTYL